MSNSLMEAIWADDWQEHSVCKKMRELFFQNAEPTRSPNLAVKRDDVFRRVRTVCYDCPVYEQCRDYAEGNYYDVQEGIFAGLTQKQRKAVHDGDRVWGDWRFDWSPQGGCTRHRQCELIDGRCRLCGNEVKFV